jgi:hypothetical protein
VLQGTLDLLILQTLVLGAQSPGPFLHLTMAGRGEFTKRTGEWQRIVRAIAKILTPLEDTLCSGAEDGL